MDIHGMIWKKFNIMRDDYVPFRGWKAGDRDTLAELFNDLGFKSGAEVGVQGGCYSQLLCQKIPGLKLKSVDPWTPYKGIREGKQNRLYASTVETLTPYGVEIIKKKSMDAVVDVPDVSLDFVYIDGLHDFNNVMMDIIHWARKVRVGGIIACHDYVTGYQVGVIHAVLAYTGAHNIGMVYLTNDKVNQSVFWVKDR
jgi:hypothetical protein